MRMLKVATIVMGVLIILGTGVVVTTIVRRATAPTLEPMPSAPTLQAAGLVPTTSPPFETRLLVRPGSHITGITAAGSLLAVSVGGASEEVVVLDPATGHTVGTVALTPRQGG